jgi:pyruvate dehydrogenase E2 component (dihydrolipoamide acetyltransferase)
MSRQFLLPDLGEGLTEAEIVAILVHEGDVIREDAPLLEVETDKAQVEIPSPMSGRVEKIHVQPGQTVKVGATLISFADAGDGGGRLAPPVVPAVSTLPRASASEPQPTVTRDIGPVPATPATRRLARELGVDLRGVHGTGPGGRVIDDDVRAARDSSKPAVSPRPVAAQPTGEAKPLSLGIEEPPLPRFEQWGSIERQPLSHLRRTIAQRMTLSASVIPHVTHFDRADITDLDGIIRRNLEPVRERGVTLTLTGFLLKAAALALRAHEQFNASLDPTAGVMVLKRYYHLGVAVATDRGLIVPVMRDVDKKPLLEVARELGALAQRVREGKATLEDLRGGTFTITNLGALGGTGAIPIINYPEVAILGVARAREEAIVRDGQIVPRLMLPLALTFDHRIADGADGARFAADIVRLLEHPEQLLLEL